MFKLKYLKTAVVLFIILFTSGSVMARDMSYCEIDIENISRYIEDRIAYQQIENVIDPELHQKEDTSIASLLIIKDKRMYLFKDGYDDHKIIEENRLRKEMENELIYNELWERIIDNKPDYLIITDRRTEILKRITTDNKSNLDETYSKYYETIRNKFIQEHVDVLRGLIINRKDSELKIIRTPLTKKDPATGKTLYFTSVAGKTKDGFIYYAEDADGDEVTETFSVNLPDGFNWGYKSGPNIIFIFQNKQESIKNIIGKLTKEAVEGTDEEGKIIADQFKTLENDTVELINDIIRMDDETSKILGKPTWEEKHNKSNNGN